MPWRELVGCEKNHTDCATHECGGVPRYRLEVEGVGSDYCARCRMLIEPCDTCGLPVDKLADACSHCG